MIKKVSHSVIGDYMVFLRRLTATERPHHYLPKHIGSHRFHKIFTAHVQERLISPDDSRVREHDIQSPVFCNCLINHGFHSCLIRGIELLHMNLDIGVQ